MLITIIGTIFLMITINSKRDFHMIKRLAGACLDWFPVSCEHPKKKKRKKIFRI